jgi:hypothetical protein
LSRLDSFIRRLEAQRACLDRAAELISSLDGPLLELGLGNGRTYDHLRERLPERQIFVFDREVNAHPACRPGPGFLLLGDIHTTLPGALERIGRPAALAHSDMGSGDAASNAELALWLARTLPPVMAAGAVVVADQPLADPRLMLLSLPPGVPGERYFMYRVEPARI